MFSLQIKTLLFNVTYFLESIMRCTWEHNVIVSILQTHHVYSTLKRCRFNVEYTWCVSRVVLLIYRWHTLCTKSSDDFGRVIILFSPNLITRKDHWIISVWTPQDFQSMFGHLTTLCMKGLRYQNFVSCY